MPSSTSDPTPGPAPGAQLQASVADQPDSARRPAGEVRLVLPWEVGDYADFYASLEHATNMGRLLRPDGEPVAARPGGMCRSATTAGPAPSW